MKKKEVKLGMKVVPFQKTSRGTFENFVKWTWNDSVKFFVENGYLYVTDVFNSTHFFLGVKPTYSMGDVVFSARDFNPYHRNLFETEE